MKKGSTIGTILIDRQAIRDVTQGSRRGSIAMIPQAPSLFHRSLIENIRYGRINTTDEEVMEAAKKAHAHAILKNAPILILDEATSQLDSVTESLIQASL